MLMSQNHSINSQSDCKVVVYVPCHYDFSHLEYVAPFFQQFQNSKVFVYKWHKMKQRIVDHYKQEEWSKFGLQVFDFTLANIIDCAINEPHGTKVVFLMTASTSYAFGDYQKKLLQSISQAVPEKIWGVSVIGHCSYGCMSCKGADHKIPVYYTRYVRKSLPYDANFVQQKYEKNKQPGSKTILVSTSTGETTMILNMNMLEHLLELQNAGKYHFIFKLHPACFNLGDYDMTYDPAIREVENVKFIHQHFAVTDEDEPCLLPFFEAFDTVLCDLHSSVPFIASYFSPSVIMAYHNDANYEVPDRDPEFLANQYIFDDFDGLKRLLENLPSAKGNSSFFKKIYGVVDGNEVDRFAKLAKWPINDSVQDAVLNQQSWRKYLRLALENWKQILQGAYDKSQVEQGDGEDFFTECLLAVGTDEKFIYDPKLFQKMQVKMEENTDETKILSSNLKVLSFNIWVGGTAHPGGLEVNGIVDVIVASKADVICIQECATPEILDTPRVSQLPKIAQALTKKTGRQWHSIYQGNLTPGKYSKHPYGFVTSLNVVSQSIHKFGIEVLCENGRTAFVFNVHLPYFPYQPYQLEEIPYDGQPSLKSESEVIDSSRNCRLQELKAVLNDVQETVDQGYKGPIILCSDFNEPSHLDWTQDSCLAGYHTIKVDWPCSKLMAENGFQDCYRKMNQDEIIKPGFTWNPRKSLFDSTEKHDRIDFVYLMENNSEVKIVDAKILGPQNFSDDVKQVDQGIVDKVVTKSISDYVSDHRAVLVELKF